MCCVCSNQGDTVLGILIDLNAFWAYENREVIMPEEADVWIDGDRFVEYF